MSVDDASAALSEIKSTLLVVGTPGDQGPHFMVANWATQASFDPWRYVVALKRTSHTLTYAQKARAFTVNLLHPGDATLVKEVLKTKGDGLPGTDGPAGAPRLPQAYAGFDCKVLQVLDIGGDHMLVVADVVDGWKKADGPVVEVGDLKMSYAG